MQVPPGFDVSKDQLGTVFKPMQIRRVTRHEFRESKPAFPPKSPDRYKWVWTCRRWRKG
jgi:hypothetical protein